MDIATDRSRIQYRKKNEFTAEPDQQRQGVQSDQRCDGSATRDNGLVLIEDQFSQNRAGFFIARSFHSYRLRSPAYHLRARRRSACRKTLKPAWASRFPSPPRTAEGCSTPSVFARSFLFRLRRYPDCPSQLRPTLSIRRLPA